MRTPWGPGVSIPTDNGAEIEALAGSDPSFAAWEQNECYTIALLLKGRSGGAGTKHLYRSGSSSTADHILFLTSGTTPNLRHQASSGTVTITSSVAIVNDTTWSTIVGTWRPGRLELYVDGFSRASSTAAATNTSALFGNLPLGLGLLDLAGLQRRYRADRVLRLVLDPRHGPPLARRSVRLPAPMERVACAYGQCATRHAPLDRHRCGRLHHGVASSSAPSPGNLPANDYLALGPKRLRPASSLRRNAQSNCQPCAHGVTSASPRSVPNYKSPKFTTRASQTIAGLVSVMCRPGDGMTGWSVGPVTPPSRRTRTRPAGPAGRRESRGCRPSSLPRSSRPRCRPDPGS